MPVKTVHLICNAHLDPVWLWEWEEGAAVAVSTFRTAADLCEEFDGFVFNHNEAILYRWVEEYEPQLFRRIQELVRAGKWHIMGGWHLQPDCNMPSGESLVRQILLGRRYFHEKFGVRPTTAINFDPFGHSRGLVQVLARSGYDGYIVCRPGQSECPLPANTFLWEGLDGSQVTVTRPVGWYNSPLGSARKVVEERIAASDDDCTVILWGVGNHGGGPSRKDLRDLRALMSERRDVVISHSSPEVYFRDLSKRGSSLPVVRKALNPWGVGCYTSQVRIKQRHRLLENELYATEKMVSSCAAYGLMVYPKPELKEAMFDLAGSQFHDILPGSSIQEVETTSLRLLDHGLEALSRVKARAFFALAAGQPRAKAGRIPILVYNPHPFAVSGVMECEFHLAEQIWTDGDFVDITVFRNGKKVNSQVEQEASSVSLEWRKKVVFAAELLPGQMNRFDCEGQILKAVPAFHAKAIRGSIRLKSAELDVVINTRTGLMDRYVAGGREVLCRGAGALLVIRDNEDPWGSEVTRFRDVCGRFRLLSREKGAVFSGLKGKKSLPSVRVIEDGSVRTVVEAVFGYGDSFACRRYKIPKRGTEIEIETRVFWNEKNRMLKLALPTPLEAAEYRGQTVFGHDVLPADGSEAVAQKWVAAVSRTSRAAVTVINEGMYGSDFKDGEIRLSLLRSPAYSALAIGDRALVPQDRFSPRIDQGEFVFRVWVNGGSSRTRMAAIDCEALAHNETPMALSFFPSGEGKIPRPFVTLSDPAVHISALKKAEDGEAFLLRLAEPTGRKRMTVVTLPAFGMRKRVTLARFEVRTYKVNIKRRTWRETNLVEE